MSWLIELYEGDWIEKGFLVFLVLCVLAIPLFVYASIEAEKQWVKWANEHHCKIVGQVSGSSSVGTSISADGKVGTVITNSPSKTGYACDDGVTYWR